MKSISTMILDASQRFPEGEVLTTKVFQHLGSAPSVRRCLSRLAQSGQMLRISRGLYAVPVVTRFGVCPPMTNKIIKSLAAISNEVIVISGATAANALGLTTQVPVRAIYLTNGRARTLQLGKSSVQIRRAPEWLMSLGAGQAGDAIRALDWGVWGAMEPKTNVSSESHRKGAFRSPAHPPGITL